jgi:iron complex outermembrane receptor protein
MKKRLLASLCLSPLIWGIAAPAYADAETNITDAKNTDDGEILVTARRVEEKVRDVPATISVLTESAIRASGMSRRATCRSACAA